MGSSILLDEKARVQPELSVMLSLVCSDCNTRVAAVF
jgi:hypothetical protein